MSADLSAEDRARLETLFDRAADLPRAEHGAFVERECGVNVALRDELGRLLAGLAGDDLLERIRPGAQPRTGTRIGPYRLLEKIGEGGMGEVYVVEQLEPVVRRVALKIIKPGMDSAAVIARFEAERQALARMTHANIAQVFDAGTTESGTPYFVMEYVAGEPITDYCDRRKLSTRARLELFLDVCNGVQHAHQKGIIHRDLKPSNLLVAQQDARAIPKIIDFGVARATTGRLAERTLHTMLGQLVGTLDYMSPEQADPTALDIDTRSDIYSLGVVLYQLVSGLLPFEHRLGADQALSEVQRVIREKDPPTPSTRLRKNTGTATALAPLHGTDERSLLRQLSGDLDWICMKALEKDPARRYASASEMADDLRRHLAHEPVFAGRPGSLYRARKFVRRHRMGVAAGTLITVAVLAGVTGVVSGRLEAAASATKVLRLSDVKRLQELLATADQLWPAVPEKIPAMQTWLASARELDSKLEEHRRTLEQRTWNLETQEDEWHHAVLSELIEDLKRLRSGLLAQDAVTDEHGWSMPKRLAAATELESAFRPGGRYADAWQRDLPALRAAYPGVALSPQLGLVPLGPDPQSGLWEFAHVMTGEPAVRGADGRVVLSDAMGLVLVLIPGGTFTMGAQWQDPQGENYDEFSEYFVPGNREDPPLRVTLEPFFLSKYEMTQGQWERFVGHNPSFGTIKMAMKPAALNPVNLVSATDCDRAVQRLGLALPSEEQWEYAARAGTTSIWSTGDEEASLQGFANLFDRAAQRRFPNFLRGEPVADLDDRFATIAPVGSFKANPWGLHDVHGNVLEWCSNGPYRYGKAPGPNAGSLEFRGVRGGSARTGAVSARCAWRQNGSVTTHEPTLGLRPARAIDTKRAVLR